MPLTPLQRVAIKALKPFRTTKDYVGGGAALNKSWQRLSDDMDIFRDEFRSFPRDVRPELAALKDAGFGVDVISDNEWTVEAILRQYGEETRIQWMWDPETCKRFFPAQDDEDLGYRLHQADAAVNKVLCASRRQQAARDAVDLANIVKRYCSLGPLVWAVVGKDPNQTPPTIIKNLRSNAFGYSDDEIRTVRMEHEAAIGRDELRRILTPAFDAASHYCDEVAPNDYLGHLFIDQNEVPMEADADSIKNGRARTLQVQDFSVLPSIPEK